MSSNLEEFRAKFKLDALTIATFEHWTWSVRPVHSTLGAGILSLNRFCPSLASMTPAESADLGVAAQHIEATLGGAFVPEKMNYIMLMMVDAHLHFHVLPRYSEAKSFAGLEWVDSGWPTPPALGDYQDRAEDIATLTAIRDALAK